MSSHIATPSFSGPNLCRLEAHQVVDLLKAKELSPAELLDAAYARIAEVGPAINATPTLCLDRAHQMARLGGLENEQLAGLPISIKDLTQVEGVLTTFGTAGLADFVPTASDPLVRRLEANGGIVIGKTNTPEFGAGGNTFNDVFGATRNPWNTKLNAGGSSGGAAASLAAGEVWLSHGSDHGGSLRTPAAYCGIVGLRPSPNRVAGGGASAFQLEGAQGPMARSVRDCGLFLDAMCGLDPRAPLSFDTPQGIFQTAAMQPMEQPRIAFTTNFGGWSPIDAEVDDHLRKTMKMLDGGGADIEELCPELRDLEPTYHTLRGMMWATLALRLPKKVRDGFKPKLEENTRMGEALTMGDIANANLNRTTIFHEMAALFETHDVLACPTVGCMPHAQSEEWVEMIDGQIMHDYMDWLRPAFLATVTGLPAISVPVGLGPRGLPVGLQLIGKPRGEAALLSIARHIELAVGGPLGPIDPVI